MSEVEAERFRMKKVHAELVEAMVGQDDFCETLVNARPNLLDYIPAEGVAVWWEGKVTRHGPTPTDEQLGALVEWLNTSVPEGVFLTDCLASIFAPARNYTGVASGLLALSVSRTPRDYLLWFRPEVSRTVTWAGDPAKPVDITGDGLRPALENPSRPGKKLCASIRGPGANLPQMPRRRFASLSWMSFYAIKTKSCASAKRRAGIRIS